MGKRGKKVQKVKQLEGENFTLGEHFSHGCKILAYVFFFWSTFPSNLKYVKLVLTQIVYAWVDQTNLALIACKNYKISHKMRSIE